MKALGKWLELLLLLLPLQLLPLTEMGFCSACSSTKARLQAAMFGEGVVLVTSGDISCFRQSGRVCTGSEVARASVQRVGKEIKKQNKAKTNGEHGWK